MLSYYNSPFNFSNHYIFPSFYYNYYKVIRHNAYNKYQMVLIYIKNLAYHKHLFYKLVLKLVHLLYSLYKSILNHHHLLNQQIVLRNETFTVVGLLHIPPAEQDFRFKKDQERDSTLYIPYTTWYDLFASDDGRGTTNIRILTGKESSARTAGKSLFSYLRSQFGPQEKPEIDFFYEKLEQQLKEAHKSLNNMLFMGIIAMIAGGIGIMNVTMAVIFSRTKEIGIRRALGASRKDILFQFVVEAMLLGLCGAIAGMILGYMSVLHLAEDTSQMTFSWWVVALSVLIALVTSFLFALYPAWQAAKLKPVEALKNE